MSDRQDIRNQGGFVIGCIINESSGDIRVESAGGRVLGYYRHVQNRTETAGGRTIALGNQVGLLLSEEYNPTYRK